MCTGPAAAISEWGFQGPVCLYIYLLSRILPTSHANAISYYVHDNPLYIHDAVYNKDKGKIFKKERILILDIYTVKTILMLSRLSTLKISNVYK